MAREVLELNRGERKPDDKDHYANKRLKLAGNLMEELFRSGLQALLNDMKYQMERSYSKRKENRVHHAVRRDVLTNKIMHAIRATVLTYFIFFSFHLSAEYFCNH